MRFYLTSITTMPILFLLAAGPLGAADVQKGQTLYAAKCASCHAKDLKGNPAMAKVFKIDQSKLDFTSKGVMAKSDADLTATTTKGKDKMPAQAGKLKPDEIDNIIAYIRSVAGGSSEKAK